MFEQLKQLFIKPFAKIKNRVVGFISPIKGSVLLLLNKLPNRECGSKDLSENELDNPEKKQGILERLKNFKNSLKGLGDFQKLILITIAVCLPAGIFISLTLVGIFKRCSKRK